MNLTTTGQQLGNCITTYPSQDTYNGIAWYTNYAIAVCSGNSHVWKCDHTKTCQCGKAQRELPICPHCSK